MRSFRVLTLTASVIVAFDVTATNPIHSESRTLPAGRLFSISQLSRTDSICLIPGHSSYITPLAPAFSMGFEAMDNENVCGKNPGPFCLVRPSDTDVAVGPGHVVAVTGGVIGIYGKDGSCRKMVSLTNWFGNPYADVLSGGTHLADPRIAFDPVESRWIIVAQNVPTSTSAQILVSVSSTSDPTGSWRNWALDGMLTFGMATQPDFPDVGFDNLTAAQGGAMITPAHSGDSGSYTVSAAAGGCIAPTSAPFVVTVGSSFYTLFPCRLFDTRDANGPLGGPPLQPGATRTFSLASVCGLPASGTIALSVNATVVGGTAGGYVTLFPGGTSLPVASTVNFQPGQVRGNNAVVRLAADGTLNVYNGASSTTNLILDVNGYFE